MGVDAINRWWMAWDKKIKGVKHFYVCKRQIAVFLAVIKNCLQLLSNSFAEKCIPFTILHCVSVIFISNSMFKDILKILRKLYQNENRSQVIAKLLLGCFQEFWVQRLAIYAFILRKCFH